MGYGIVGSRSVKQYRLKDDTIHWSLWEQKGTGEQDAMASDCRRVRVGTAHTEAEVSQFLGMVDKDIEWTKQDMARLESQWFELMQKLSDLEAMQEVEATR